MSAVVRAEQARVGDFVEIADRSLNFGDLHGRAAILTAIRDDADGYDYHVQIIETAGLTYRGPVYETRVSDIAPLTRPVRKAGAR